MNLACDRHRRLDTLFDSLAAPVAEPPSDCAGSDSRLKRCCSRPPQPSAAESDRPAPSRRVVRRRRAMSHRTAEAVDEEPDPKQEPTMTRAEWTRKPCCDRCRPWLCRTCQTRGTTARARSGWPRSMRAAVVTAQPAAAVEAVIDRWPIAAAARQGANRELGQPLEHFPTGGRRPSQASSRQPRRRKFASPNVRRSGGIEPTTVLAVRSDELRTHRRSARNDANLDDGIRNSESPLDRSAAPICRSRELPKLSPPVATSNDAIAASRQRQPIESATQSATPVQAIPTSADRASQPAGCRPSCLPRSGSRPAADQGPRRSIRSACSPRRPGLCKRPRTASGEVRLRLSPPELGALRLEVRVQEGALVGPIGNGNRPLPARRSSKPAGPARAPGRARRAHRAVRRRSDAAPCRRQSRSARRSPAAGAAPRSPALRQRPAAASCRGGHRPEHRCRRPRPRRLNVIV